MKCKQCNNELTGKKQYCNDACRMAYGRKANKHPEQAKPNRGIQTIQVDSITKDIVSVTTTKLIPVVSLEHYQANPTMYATRTNPTLINWGKPMTFAQLNKAGLKGNRTPIPGDHDYHGVWQKQGVAPITSQDSDREANTV